MAQTYWAGKGRWIGYLSYDLGRLFEELPEGAVDDLGLPLFVFTYCRLVGERLYAPDAEHGEVGGSVEIEFYAARYETAVARAIEFIGAGDVFQVNLSQRFTVGLAARPVEIFITGW